MGQKVHPYGLRLGIIRQPKSTWFAEGKQYREQLLADVKMRRHLETVLANAGVSSIHIDRSAGTVTIAVSTAKPGIVIGRGGRDVEVLRQQLEAMCGQRVRVNVEEAKGADMDAHLVAQNIARQIERRVSFRRAMRQSMDRAMRIGAHGIRVTVSGRLQGAEIARTESVGPEGRVPLHTLRADIEYGLAEAKTGYGNIGVKVWIYKGDILPPRKVKTGDLYDPEAEAVQETVEGAQDASAEETPAEAAAPEATEQAAAPAAPAAPDQTEDAFATEAPAAPAEPEVEREPAYDPQDTVIAVEAVEEGDTEQ